MAFDTIDNMVKSKNPTLYASTSKDDRIDEAKLYVSECFFKTKYNYAVSLMALHLLALDAMNGGDSTDPNVIGSVKSHKEDRIRIELSKTGNVTDDALSITQYGSSFLMLRKTLTISARTRLMGC